MKKIGVLLCLVALTTGAFASQTDKMEEKVVRKVARAELRVNKQAQQEVKKLLQALENYRNMASKSTPDQTGMILPAIAQVSDIYLANRDGLKKVANKINTPVTFKNGAQMSMTRYIDQFASEMDNLDAFKTALEEDCQAQNDKEDNKEVNKESKAEKSIAQIKFEETIAGFNGDANVIGQYILFNLADPMRKLTDEEATPLAKDYIHYNVNGVSLVQFCERPGVNWHESALDELAAFGERVARLAK